MTFQIQEIKHKVNLKNVNKSTQNLIAISAEVLNDILL